MRGQRPLAIGLTVLGLAGLMLMGFGAHWSVGAHSVAGPARGQSGGDVAALGRSVFTTYLFAFEITSALLVIAVVGAVVLARRPGGALDAGNRPRRRAHRRPTRPLYRPKTRNRSADAEEVAP